MANMTTEQPPAPRDPPSLALRVRPSIPFVPVARPAISPQDEERLESIAARLLRDEPALGAVSPFGAHARAGLAIRGPALVFEDHSGLALFARRGVVLTEYRPLLLAGDGDFIAIGERPDPAFEAYCRDVLGLGKVERLFPAPEPGPVHLPRRLLRDADCMNRLVAAARRDGAISLVPYYSDGGCWILARELAARSGAEVRVAAALPRLTRRVNDKLWFADRVAEVLGRRARPMTLRAWGPAALAAELQTLARRYGRLVVKIPDSAGSLGNMAVEADDILARPLAELRDWLVDMLAGRHWEGGWPLLTGVWDSPSLASPSVQTWIPEAEEGPPLIEGIFEQVVEGPRGAFVGSLPSDLPAEWVLRLTREAMLLARLFQRLGYYGRCSFDAVLAGETQGDAQLHWIECNGRWGGVSIPMTLANRLTGDWRRRPFVVVQREEFRLPPLGVDEAAQRLGGLLFRPGAGDEGILFLTPRLMAEGRGLHFMALARSAAAAQTMAREGAALLSGRPA